MVFRAATRSRAILPRLPLDSNHYHWWDCYNKPSLTSIPDIGSSASPAPLVARTAAAQFGITGNSAVWGPRPGPGYPRTSIGMRATCSDITEPLITAEALVYVHKDATTFAGFILLGLPGLNYRMGLFQQGASGACILGSLSPSGDNYVGGGNITPSDGAVHSVGWTFNRSAQTMTAYWDGVIVCDRTGFVPNAINPITVVDIGHALDQYYMDVSVLSCGISNIARPQSYFQSVTTQIAASSAP